MGIIEEIVNLNDHPERLPVSKVKALSSRIKQVGVGRVFDRIHGYLQSEDELVNFNHALLTYLAIGDPNLEKTKTSEQLKRLKKKFGFETIVQEETTQGYFIFMNGSSGVNVLGVHAIIFNRIYTPHGIYSFGEVERRKEDGGQNSTYNIGFFRQDDETLDARLLTVTRPRLFVMSLPLKVQETVYKTLERKDNGTRLEDVRDIRPFIDFQFQAYTKTLERRRQEEEKARFTEISYKSKLQRA